MRHLLAFLPVLFGLATQEPTAQRVWANDEEWSLSSYKSFLNPRTPGLNKLYVIAPVFNLNPQIAKTDGIVRHDFVADVPRGHPKEVEIGGKVLVVMPGYLSNTRNTASRTVETNLGSLTLLYAADVDGDGIVDPLTSKAKVERAIELNLAATQECETAFFCTMTLQRIR